MRDSPDQVEKIGIERAWKEIEEADQILLMIDSTDEDQLDVDSHWEEFVSSDEYNKKLTVIYNKIDESSFKISKNNTNYHEIAISALEGSGIDDLKDHLKTAVGYQGTVEGGFSARRRHIAALEQALSYIDSGEAQLSVSAGELLAEDLKVAQNYLSEITGAFTADDLLGQIFSSFCIGK